MSFILGILVTIFSLALTLIGLPAQIAKNYREKRSGQPHLTILILSRLDFTLHKSHSFG